MMEGKRGRAFVIILALVGVGIWTSLAWGAGFALVQQGTAAMAQGNAFVAEANDPSAIFYNPAGLNQLKQVEFYQGTFLNHPDREFHGDDGTFSETNHRLYHNASAYLAAPINDRLALGFGFFSPFGLGTAWPPTWEGRYISTLSKLKTYNLNPVASVKLLENLSLAAGFDAMWSSVELKKKNQILLPTPKGVIQLPDGESRLTGDGCGLGYNLGLLYEPIHGVKLGVSYRSDITLTYRGNLSLTLPPQLKKLQTPPLGGAAGLTFPPSVTWGINYARLKPFTFEFDTTWTGWSSYDETRIGLSTPIRLGAKPTFTLVTPKKWQDAWAFRFGGSYELREGMKIRAGYIYDLSPVPDSTFDPQLPDANRHIFTVGGDLKIKRFTLGFAYNYILSEERTKNNIITQNGAPAPLQANGRYNTDVHSLGVSWSFRF
jgi:long-chain fatty acid transport protein